MTTLTVKQRILGQTTRLLEQLEEAKPVFDSLSPSEQLSNANQFTAYSKLLTELQKKVEATYKRGQDAIPDFTEEELLGIAERLTACADSLKPYIEFQRQIKETKSATLGRAIEFQRQLKETKSATLGRAIEFQRQLKETKSAIGNLSPSEQLIAIPQFIQLSKSLTKLQETTKAIYKIGQDAIPQISEEELLATAKKFTACTDILKSLDESSQTAQGCVDIASAVDKLYQSSTPPNASEVESLQGRIQELTSAYPYMNKGNKEALEIANQSLRSMLIQSSAPCTTETSGVRNSSTPQYSWVDI